MQAGVTEQMTVIRFGDGQPAWHDVSDPVMGGLSRCELVISGQVGVFQGVVSLDHGGGFAQVRSSEGRNDLAAFHGLVVRAQGDGKRYGFRLRGAASSDGVNHQVDLQPGRAWQDFWFAFRDFRPIFRGRPAVGHPPLDPSSIRAFGLIIAHRQAGPFRLELESIAAYRESAR
jgi:NADH dehydrogenase [ubiquinone] 1 alpha subcomplex assembly factor 1